MTGDASSLDGKYTAFGRVVDGMAAVDAIEQTPVNGETPITRIELVQRPDREVTRLSIVPHITSTALQAFVGLAVRESHL